MNLFNYIKEKVHILDVVSSYTTVKKAGLYWKGNCPFHAEKTASFTVSPHKEIFYCFGCQAGGDVITFISKAENSSALEAAQLLAERYNIDMPEEKFEFHRADQKIEEKKRHYHLCSLVANWCHQKLLADKSAMEYLHSRGINNASIKHFNLGYFPGGNKHINDLISFVKKDNFMAYDLIAQAQVLMENKTYLYSPFEERIIFPITDHLGRCTGFGARTFKPRDERPKYYNSKENAFFDKGSLLFGLEQAKKSIQHHQKAFMVEGYIDCLLVAQSGLTNCIATLGTACTLEHLQQLNRYTAMLYVLYDGDTAGRNAIMRLTKLCWQTDLDLKVIILPEGHDPASYLAKGGQLQPLIDQAKDIFLYFIDTLGASFADKPLKQKLQLTHKLLELIATVTEPLKQDFLVQAAAQSLNIPFSILKNELARTHATSNPTSAKPASSHSANELKPITALENKLFSVIINNMELIFKKEVAFLLDYFSEPLRTILHKAQSSLNNQELSFTNFFHNLDAQQQNLVSSLMIESPESQSS